MREPNAERNDWLYRLRERDKKVWTFGELGRKFNLTAATAFEIYQRERARRSPNSKAPISRTIARRYPKLVGRRDVGIYRKK